MLVAVTDFDSSGNGLQVVELSYDMFGQRLSKVVDGVATYFVYDRDDVILDFVDDGAGIELDMRYLHGSQVDEVLAQEDGNGDVVWLLRDYLGTIRDLVDNTGDVVNHLTYDSYGNLVSETNSAVDSRYRFTGREWDEEIDLYYYRARYYSGETGRFISVVPISFDSGTYNLYGYVDNNPVSNSDPSGLVTFAIPGADGLDNLAVNISRLPLRRFGVFALSGDPVIDIPLALGLIQFRQTGEPINIIAHSNGNLSSVPFLVPALRFAVRNCEPVQINVGRLDLTFVPKAFVIGANKIVDVGSNNPGSSDIRDRGSLAFLRPDFRARQGVGHNDLLNEWPILFVLAYQYGFQF
ncbi:RHS repeat-associated core domain-containing protein [Cyanobacterium aponinum UTEX 3222]|uniref:RHS repeat domain-containing protein n=1 Tax=Cyanobacterium aponinum TaxID=379064 RepID=UPI003093A070|nr:RHS repeat-associated core domain-containing protein [Cyanobacterium aponinum UTEX 3222]